MTGRTTHILPTDGGWAVMKDAHSTRKGARTRAKSVYPTQKEAIAAARRLASKASAWEVLLHGRNGSYRIVERHGLPEVRNRPNRSSLAREAIRKAVSAIIRERLLGK